MTTETITIHGHGVTYRVAGPLGAPVVALVHGMAGSSSTWREVIDRLGESHRVVAPDLLGHGRSDKPQGDYSLGAHASLLRDLLTSLDVERATIVGQSLGGGVAMQFAYQYPEMCERLVLVNSGGLGRDVNWMLRLLSLPGTELVLPIAVPRFVTERGDALSRWLYRKGVRPPRVAEMWQAYASLSNGESRTAFLRTLRSVVDAAGQTVSARDRLYLTESMPTLIVWGDEDPIIPMGHGIEAHEAMPGSRLEVFEGVGHFPHVEAPERFSEVLLDFIATTEPAISSASSRG